MAVKTIMIIAVICLALGCRMVREKQMLEIAMTQGVPKTSTWVGHKDGGQWVNFVFEKDSVFHIDTYNDHTNELSCRYTYRVICSSIQKKEIQKAFKFTNGDKVFWRTESKVYPCLKFIKKRISE